MFVPPDARSRRRVGAIYALELILLSPAVMALCCGVIELSLMLNGQAQVAHASREGARIAAVGGSEQDVQNAVHRVLGDRVANQANVQTNLPGNNGRPLRPGDPAIVVVDVPATSLVPDMLGYIGFSISRERLLGRTIMRKE